MPENEVLLLGGKIDNCMEDSLKDENLRFHLEGRKSMIYTDKKNFQIRSTIPFPGRLTEGKKIPTVQILCPRINEENMGADLRQLQTELDRWTFWTSKPQSAWPNAWLDKPRPSMVNRVLAKVWQKLLQVHRSKMLDGLKCCLLGDTSLEYLRDLDLDIYC